MDEKFNLVVSTGEQADVFDEALRIFTDRNQKYRDTWKQSGALGNLLRTAQKIDRLMAVWWHDEPGEMSGERRPPLTKADLDDAYDVINHCAFFIRCAQEGNLTGYTPERPSIQSVDGGHFHLVNSAGELIRSIPVRDAPPL